MVSSLFTLLALSTQAGIVGVWNGKFEEAPSGITRTDAARGNVPTLVFKADHTWSQKIGTPGRFKITAGRWKLDKQKLTLWTTSVEGNAIKKPVPRTLTVAANFTSITATITARTSPQFPKPVKYLITYRKAK